jgi:alkylation response protein AidB-like acyl-CoA dehydrogenase
VTSSSSEILPVATKLEHADEYPSQIVEGMKEMGLFGLMIPEEYGGLGESLLTYALVVEEIARGWMSVSGIINTHFIVAYMIKQHGTEEQKATFLPKMATGDVRGAFSMSEPASAPTSPRSARVRVGTVTTTSSTARRCGSPTAARRTWSRCSARPTTPTRRTRA